LRISGRARFEYEVRSQRGPADVLGVAPTGSDVSGFRGLGRLNLDARTQTAYGTLRTFIRFELAKRSGLGVLRSGT
jgi:Porin subfamily